MSGIKGKTIVAWFTLHESSKLTMSWIAQSMKMIQTEELFWNGVDEICRKIHGLEGRSKNSLRCKVLRLLCDLQLLM